MAVAIPDILSSIKIPRIKLPRPFAHHDPGDKAQRLAAEWKFAKNDLRLHNAAKKVNDGRRFWRNAFGLLAVTGFATLAVPLLILPDIGMLTILTALILLMNRRINSTNDNEKDGQLYRDWAVVRRAVRAEERKGHKPPGPAPK